MVGRWTFRLLEKILFGRWVTLRNILCANTLFNRFHTVYLPAILLALNLPLQKRILAHAHWTSSQKKMSKSLGNTTDPFEAMQTYGVDPIRYFMATIGGNFRDDVGMRLVVSGVHFLILQRLV